MGGIDVGEIDEEVSVTAYDAAEDACWRNIRISETH